jgi:hypothetical protein
MKPGCLIPASPLERWCKSIKDTRALDGGVYVGAGVGINNTVEAVKVYGEWVVDFLSV